MPKRKSSAVEDEQAEPAPPRRSTRHKPEPTAAAVEPAPAKPRPKKAVPSGTAKASRVAAKKRQQQPEPAKAAEPKKAPAKAKAKRGKASESESIGVDVGVVEEQAGRKGVEKVTAKPAKSKAEPSSEPAPEGSGKQYWLMKAEPESRFENGVDVKFSIDDLAARTKPEPWDGIRAYPARNNLRAMKKGDLAFFYHSNCKEPGIVGTMEIVQEHSPDLSAHDPKAPYYDPSSKPSDPKWSVVHVQFRSKFAAPILLKELREMGAPGRPLENMQMLKQSRLSVSRVSPSEWEYLVGVAEERAQRKS